jgi:Flp pilus assembly protein TadD
MRCLSALVVAVLAGGAAGARGAQAAVATSVLHGEVSCDCASRYAGLTVELIGGSDALPVARARVAATGEFEVPSVPFGSYHVRVADGAGRLIQEDFVTVAGGRTWLRIRLPDKDRPASGTVSLAQLRRKIPRAARREFARARETTRAGDIQSSMAHLRKAIEIEPDFMEAHNNLGIRHLELGQHELAAEQFRIAVELDHNAAPAFSNLGVALARLGQLPEAEKAARRAVEMDGTNRKCRLVLGVILAAQERDHTEALVNLRAVEKNYPTARLAIAGILVRQGERGKAAAELRSYLKLSGTRYRPQVEGWLARIDRDADQPAQR